MDTFSRRLGTLEKDMDKTLKTGKVTGIYINSEGRHIEIQVRCPAGNASRIDVYSVRTDSRAEVGQLVVLPNSAVFRESFFA